MIEPKYKVYDKVKVFGRVVTIIDIGVYNDEYVYTAESAGGYESFSEDCIVQSNESTFTVGQIVAVADVVGLSDNVRPLQRCVIKAIDKNDICQVEFLDGTKDWLMSARLIAVEDEPETNIQNDLDSIIQNYLNTLDNLAPLNPFKESVTNDKIQEDYINLEGGVSSLKIERDIFDFYRIDLNPKDVLADKLILSKQSFNALFKAMRKL
jgi:hypothetical protein